MFPCIKQIKGKLIASRAKIILAQILFLQYLGTIQSAEAQLIRKSIENDNHLIDERFPLVMGRHLVDGNKTYDGLFGASIALSSRSSWMFIGEPKGNTSGNNKEPGVLWRCKMSPEIQCSPWEIESTVPGASGHSFFGGSVISMADGSIVSCAPHLVSKIRQGSNNERYEMPGECFQLFGDNNNFRGPSNRLEVNDTFFRNVDKLAAFGLSLHSEENLRIWAGAPVFNYGFGAIGHVALNQSRQPEMSWNYLTEDPNTYFGYAVTSGKYFKDKQKYIVGGLPRQNNLKGKVILFKPRYCPLESSSCSQQITDYKSLEGSHVGSYFGSVLFTQDIDGDGMDELFVGAPRSSCDEIPDSLERNADSLVEAQPRWRANGKRLVESGCVYVYREDFNETGSLKKLRILAGRRKPFARFGTAISAFGDLEKDGSTVIVIGAPHEDNNGGAIYFYEGRQLLKNGNYLKRIGAADSNFVNLPTKLKGFGYSISAAQDVDGNETPDLSVGSYSSGQAVLLRSRHKINLLPTAVHVKLSPINVLPANESILKVHTSRNFKLVVVLQCRFPGKSAYVQRHILHENLVFWSRIKLDEKFRRFKIYLDDKRLPHVELDDQIIEFGVRINQSSFLTGDGELGEASVELSVVGVKDVEDLESDIQPLEIVANSWFNESHGLQKSLFSYDIDQGTQGSTVKFINSQIFIPFLPASVSNEERKYIVPINNDCRISTKCAADVTVVESKFLVFKNGRYEAINRLALGAHSEIILHWKLTNHELDKADSPGTLLRWNHPYISITSEFCRPAQYNDGFWCNRTGTLPPSNKRTMTIEVKFRVQTKYINSRDYPDLKVELLTTYGHSSRMNSHVAELNIFTQAKIVLRGSSLETALEKSAVPPKIEYQVMLRGASSIQRIDLEVSIPLKRSEDIENLIGVLPEIIIMNSGGYKSHVCHSSQPFQGNSPTPFTPTTEYSTTETKSEGHTDTTTSRYTDNRRRRRRRLVEQEESTEIASRLKFNPNTTVKTYCDQYSNDRCLQINCAFLEVQAKTNFKIDFRINPSDYGVNLLNGTLDTILISSKAMASILDRQGDGRSSNFSEIKIIRLSVIEGVPAPLWIYILAIIGGFALLVVIFAVLYKCGFFKRELKHKLEDLKAKETEPIIDGEEGIGEVAADPVSSNSTDAAESKETLLAD